MPLIKSTGKKAFEKNLKEELKTKPKDQAIAYSVQKEAKKKKAKKK